jgi:integrase
LGCAPAKSTPSRAVRSDGSPRASSSIRLCTRGTKTREAKLVLRKNDEAYVLDLTEDVLAAVDWHMRAGYSGEEFLFSKTGAFPRYIDSHVRPLKLMQHKLGLRPLSHHKAGRHSVASQAVTGGESVKAVQAQLGHRSEQSTHKYAHLGSDAQRRLIEALKPAQAPHVEVAPPTHGTLASPDADKEQGKVP